MKNLILTLVVSFSLMGCASKKKIYEIDMGLAFQNGKKQEAIVRVAEGELGSIEIKKPEDKNGTFIDVVATEGELGGIKGILMQLEVGHVLPSGERVTVAKPTVLTKAGGEAEMTTQKADGTGGKMRVKVSAKRKSSLL